MKIIFVIQRYGLDIIGGAEFHCRLIAEHLAGYHQVEVVTTTARDYLTWKNVMPQGTDMVNGITVHRFNCSRVRPDDFESLAYDVLYGFPSHQQECEYIEAHGPYCPDLIDYLKTRTDVDRFVFFSYRYWTTWKGLQRFGSKSILVPTAEHDRTLHLPAHSASFRSPFAIAYNSVEECSLIQSIAHNSSVPGEIVGVGLPEPDRIGGAPELASLDLLNPYFLYIGRIEDAKGCPDLIHKYLSLFHKLKGIPDLVMVGKQEIHVPEHSQIRVLGILSEEEKTAVIQGCVALFMPSRFESLSMVVLEAWRQNKPVICNGDCEVLRGQCQRSNAGLYYRNYDEFCEVVELIHHNSQLRTRMGENGHRFFSEHYTWPVIIQKYERLLMGTAVS